MVFNLVLSPGIISICYKTVTDFRGWDKEVWWLEWKTVPYRFMYLNIWFPVGSGSWKGFKSISLAKWSTPMEDRKNLHFCTTVRNLHPWRTGRSLCPWMTGRSLHPCRTGRNLYPCMTGRNLYPCRTGRSLHPCRTWRSLHHFRMGKSFEVWEPHSFFCSSSLLPKLWSPSLLLLPKGLPWLFPCLTHHNAFCFSGTIGEDNPLSP